MRLLFRLVVLTVTSAATGCSSGSGEVERPDISFVDFAGAVDSHDLVSDLASADLACGTPNACGDCDTGCSDTLLGPPDSPFPLQGVVAGDGTIVAEKDQGLKVDASGFLTMGGPGPQHDPWPSYNLIFRGCRDAQGAPSPTDWRSVTWHDLRPSMTSIGASAASGNSASFAGPWGPFTDEAPMSPLDLGNGHLVPNLPEGKDGFLYVQFIFRTNVQGVTPRLSGIEVVLKCPNA